MKNEIEDEMKSEIEDDMKNDEEYEIKVKEEDIYPENSSSKKKEELKKKARERQKRYRERLSHEKKDRLRKLAKDRKKKNHGRITRGGKRYRENLTNEEKEQLKEKAKDQQKKYRERLSNEKKEELKRIAREQKKRYREKMSIEKKELLNRLAREQKILYREKINNERKEYVKTLANTYLQPSNIHKNEQSLAKLQQKIYRDKLREQSLKELQSDMFGKGNQVCEFTSGNGIGSKTDLSKAYIVQDEADVEGLFAGLFQSTNLDDDQNKLKSNFSGELSSGIESGKLGNIFFEPSDIDSEDDSFCGEVFEKEKRQCCGCGIILSTEESLIAHIKKMHTKNFEFIENLWNNVTIVQNLMAFKGPKIKEETTNIETNALFPQDTAVGNETVFIKPEQIICKSLEGGKTVCNSCGLILSCETLLECHMRAKHLGKPTELRPTQEDEIVQCPICHNHCNMFGLHTHINNVHFVKRSSSYGCDDCGLFFKSDECLAEHYVNLKSKMNSINFKEFDMTDFLRNMEKEKESSGNESMEVEKSNSRSNLSKKLKLYKCKLCNYAHKYSFGLLKHVLKMHLFECPLECPFCDIKTKRRDYFKSHIESMHPDTNTSFQLICEVCGYVSLNKTTFKNHVRNHSKKFECEYCDYTTSLITSINVHRRKHTKQKPYKCDFQGCEYECNHKSSLTQHNFTHYPEKYLQFCDICGFRTVNKYLMKSHLKDHNSGHDVFSCVQCPYTTNIKANLVNHSVVHKEMTQCTLCEFTTKYNLTMRRHMGTKHGIIIKNRWRKQNTVHL